MKKERINEIWGVFFLLLGLFTLASLSFFDPRDIAFFTSHPQAAVRNYTGILGAYLAFGLFLSVGISAFVIPVLFLLWSCCFFLQKVPERRFFKFIGLAIAIFAAATIVTISVEPDLRLARGGAVGYIAGTHLLRYFGLIGSYIVSGSCLLLSLLLATDFLIYPIVKNVYEVVAEFLAETKEKIGPMIEDLYANFQEAREEIEEKMTRKKETSVKQKSKSKEKESVLPDIPLKVKQYRPDLSESAEKLKEQIQQEEMQKAEAEGRTAQPKERTPASPRAASEEPRPRKEKSAENASAASASEGKHDGVVGAASPVESTYTLPPIDLLNRPSGQAGQNDDLQANSKVLEQALAQFGIEVKVIEVEQGPVITRYELMPAPGVKVNSIASLTDDLALALKAKSIRLIIPIPGKSAIGVEVPNSVSSTVSLRELIECREFHSKKCILPLVLGKTTSGKPLISDLATMPHILIAGSTGSGKTVAVNSIIMGLLYSKTPDELKFVMVDPKMVEMAGYNKIPHMLTPVVTDVRKASHTLNWVVSEMENRYRLLAAVGVRNIQGFNERELSQSTIEQTEGNDDPNVVPAKLPYIVVVIDELADLMMVAQDKVENAILRLAQLARAVGIHLILATQRPSVDVITGVIKANFPARVSFKVSSKVDSRTVLDVSGAEALIGRGDMLFLRPGEPKPIRGQAPLVVDEEINTVVKYTADQEEPTYHADITKAQEGRTKNGAEEKDELFDEALRIVVETRQASTSNLQRRLRLGYTRAARIIDQMEAEGYIGPAQGAKPRDIYIESLNEIGT